MSNVIFLENIKFDKIVGKHLNKNENDKRYELIKIDDVDQFLKIALLTPYYLTAIINKFKINKFKKQSAKIPEGFRVQTFRYFFNEYLHVPKFILDQYDFDKWNTLIKENLGKEELEKYEFILSTFKEKGNQ
jgi:hypothetical protein